jgi:hypothetical protein
MAVTQLFTHSYQLLVIGFFAGQSLNLKHLKVQWKRDEGAASAFSKHRKKSSIDDFFID